MAVEKYQARYRVGDRATGANFGPWSEWADFAGVDAESGDPEPLGLVRSGVRRVNLKRDLIELEFRGVNVTRTKNEPLDAVARIVLRG